MLHLNFMGSSLSTHEYVVEELTDGPPLQAMLHSRYVGFIRSLDFSHKHEVKLLYNICRYNLLTVTGSNIKCIMKTYKCQSIQEMMERKIEISTKVLNQIKDEDEWKPSMLEELVDMRDGRSSSNLSDDEIEYMIELISTE